ncbi:unnamed protein product [Arabis nemorensis]|uniref:Hydroxyproline-rich glycoprotein family protein n=1 Tax=Arabis nemorensis TaxID=586526 RepID=A0A565BHI4_9BRAS|nr:unnamed protein product [Arabis nemorensis]
MRGVIGRRLSNPNGFTFASILKQNPFLIQPTSHFSSSSDGSGRGRGRGGGGDGSGQFGINRNESVNQGRDSSESQTQGGYGHGRGRPIQSNPISSPPFSSSIGRGRGSEMKEETSTEAKSGEGAPRENIFNALGSEFSNPDQRIVPGNGAGRGKPFVESAPARTEGENRHIRGPQPPPPQQKRAQTPKDEAPRPQLSVEEAGRRARSELSRGEAVEGSEKFAKEMGPEWMKELAQGFEDICDKALPSTTHDAIVDAYETNLMIECEPEYIMPDFGSNPDIDEKPPMPLRECIEKVKPFIVAYEGIKDQEEWEEAVAEVMAQAPLIKEIVDHYSGPDRVTAKKQNEELDRIATTIPKSAPDSVKRFADRAALSLKSNPGWGFDKKYKFMDKLVLEVSQSYK